MDKDFEKELEVQATHMSFNCPDCKDYWYSTVKYWKGLGKEIPALLFCPTCTHRIGKKRQW